MNELRIDRTLRNIIPALTSQEYEELEKSIVFEGCRDPIVAWNGLIIDGHNRYDICKKNNIPFEVIDKEFNSKKDAFSWMITNQLGRRNLTDAQKIELVLRRDELQCNVALTTEKRKEIAKETGVGERNVAKVKKVMDNAEEEVKEKMLSGDLSINKAEKTLKPEPIPPHPEHKECPACKGTGYIKIVRLSLKDDCPTCGGTVWKEDGHKCATCGYIK